MIDGLDEYQRFQLDAALATKYELEEKDFQLDMVETIVEAIKAVVQVHSTKKLKKSKDRPRMTLSEDELAIRSGDVSKLPHIRDVRAALYSSGTVVERA